MLLRLEPPVRPDQALESQLLQQRRFASWQRDLDTQPDRHIHVLSPGYSLNRIPFLYCSCGKQVNCSDSHWRTVVGAGTLYWNMHYAQLQARIVREGRDA